MAKATRAARKAIPKDEDFTYASAMLQAIEEERRLHAHMTKVADDLTAGRIDVHEAALRLKTYWNYM